MPMATATRRTWIKQLIDNGLATEVSSRHLVPGGIVVFLTNGAVTHVTLYVATDTVAQHSSTDSAIDTVVANLWPRSTST